MTQNYSHNSKAECCPKTHTDTHTHTLRFQNIYRF